MPEPLCWLLFKVCVESFKMLNAQLNRTAKFTPNKLKPCNLDFHSAGGM